MFSQGHLIFLTLSAVLIIFGVITVRRNNVPIERLIRVCFIIALVLEAAKVFTVIEIIPVAEPAVENGTFVYKETGALVPYIQAEHMPFELCSLQIVFMFLPLAVKERRWKKRIWYLICGTSVIGGMIALLLPSIAPEFAAKAAFLTAPRAWEIFLYHSMIIVAGLSIALNRDSGLCFSDIRWMMLFTMALVFSAFYLNSIMSIPYYQGDNLVGMGYAINYFFPYNNPLGIVVSAKQQDFLYLLTRIVIALILIPAVYLPFLRRTAKSVQAEGERK